MHSFTKLFSAAATVAFVSTSAFAEFFPPPPPDFGPFPGPVYVGEPEPVAQTTKKVKFEDQLQKVWSGVPQAFSIPGEWNTDEFGNKFFEPKKIVGFELLVHPDSVDQDCVPAEKSDGFKSWTGVATNLPTKKMTHSVRTDTVLREIEGESRSWTAYQFKVNDGEATPVTSIRVFFPYKANQGRVECKFKVKLTVEGAASSTDSSTTAPPPPPTSSDDSKTEEKKDDAKSDDSSKKEESPAPPPEKA